MYVCLQACVCVFVYADTTYDANFSPTASNKNRFWLPDALKKKKKN